MADKLNDQEIANELERFGEKIKRPIDYKKRPILIKKLNHYYAKENPPPKRGRSSGRLSKRLAPAPEFSDDSHDEQELESVDNKKPASRNSSMNNSRLRETSARNLRSRNLDNGANTSSVTKTRTPTKKTQRPMELYPKEFGDEFSDTDPDTADESLYVEEKSIGINTSLNFDDTFDEEDLNPSFSLIRPKRRLNSTNATPKSRNAANVSGNHFVTQTNKQNHKFNKNTEAEQFVSKSILTLVAIFFVMLTLSYVYIRKDIFLPKEAALSKTDLKEITLNISGESKKFSGKERNEVLHFLSSDLHMKLADIKGKFELGEIVESDKQLSRSEVEETFKTYRKKVKSKSQQDVGDMVHLCFHLLIKNPKWDILALAEDGSDATIPEEVTHVESVYGNLPLSTRLMLAFYKVLYGLAVLLICVFFGVLGIIYLRWQNKRKERDQQKVYDMVEQIIDVLRNHSEIAEKKNDSKAYPPYLAVQHIRDQLIPVSKRQKMQGLWDDAVKFIEKNESRIRVETQIIQGEEYNVWRWIQAMPNGHKLWQGQAFGETSQSSVNSLPYGPTPCLKVRNMFDANMEKSADDWHIDIEEGILEKCENNNGILHIFVDRTSREGCVYIKCSSCEKAYEAYQALHGWWFDGRLITVKYLRLEHYHDRFPDSRNRKYPLHPSKTEHHSVSRPYHRSALEMT